MLGTAQSGINPRGVGASLAAVTLSSFGYALSKKWGRSGDLIATTSWQLIAGALAVVPFALIFEGAPPALDLPAIGGFTYVVLVATAGAFLAWFSGLRHLSAASVGIIGLLNPLTGVLLGTTLSGEHLTIQQIFGMVLILGGILLIRPRGSKATARSLAQHERRIQV
jgi:probable blue pigment (indigoidine) exporter